jgi:acyl-CoA hydrolase/GNAT superfamily N-acetyltransferase
MTSIPWQERYRHKVKTAAEALQAVKRGHHIFVGSGAAVPGLLVAELAKMADRLADTRIIHILTLGVAPYTNPEFTDKFRHNALFIGANVRQAVCEGRADYTPIFLSDVPALFRQGHLSIDVALIQVTPPDEEGFCSYGVSVDVIKAATESADYVIAEVNPQMPRTLGNSFVQADRINVLVENDAPIPELSYPKPDQVTRRIGENVAGLVEDGSTMQMGIGTIPDSILLSLKDKKDLGVHSEMISDGVIELIETGVITNARKTLHPGKIVTSFCMGTKRLYDYVDNNPFFEFHPCDYTNNPAIISQNDKMVAVDAALEIDLTGQVCSDSLGHLFYSGFGGQIDFIRAATQSEGGKPIIALPSTAKGGSVSRIVPTLSKGAGVVITRGDVYYVVTEYGVAYLHGLSVRERALALISIAHPHFRESLLEEAKINRYIYVDQLVPRGIYPRELETRLTLEDGTGVFFRPIKPTDEEMMHNFFYALSDRTIYQRYFSVLKAMPHSTLQYYTTIDYKQEMAIVGLVEEKGRERIIAVGRYGMLRNSDLAEMAFTVHDRWQNKGIGTFLLYHLIQIAKERGIGGFTAEILEANKPMLHILEHPAWKGDYSLESTLDDRTYTVTIRF